MHYNAWAAMYMSQFDNFNDWYGSSGSVAEEPHQIVLVNQADGQSLGAAYSSLCEDAARARVVAVDVEWAPDFRRGSNNPISVIQLAFPESQTVYVLQLERLGKRLPRSVQTMLVHPTVAKVGFAIKGTDCEKFRLSGIAVDFTSVVDVQEFCNAARGFTRITSLKAAAHKLLGVVLDKDKQIACSDWSRYELTPQQIRYAAIDAWVTLRLYYHICHS